MSLWTDKLLSNKWQQYAVFLLARQLALMLTSIDILILRSSVTLMLWESLHFNIWQPTSPCVCGRVLQIPV